MLTKTFRNTAISAFLSGLLISGSAAAAINLANQAGGYTGGTSTGGGSTTYSTTWDTFTTGLAAGKWFTAGYGTYWANNAVVEGYPNGLYVYAPGVNSISGYPAFTLSIAPEMQNGGHPGAFDHMKWSVYMNNTATSGYPGFDTSTGYTLSCSTQIMGQTFGTRYHPFGNKVGNSGDDIRLASFSQNVYDFESNMVFDFMFTNKRVYVIYERLPYGRTEWGGSKNYAAFTYAIPVAARSTTSKHQVKISYDRSAGVVQWFLNGKEVYRVSQVGRRLSSRKHMIIDLGGIEETVTPRQLNCGMGMFTLLDGASGNSDGLVRLSQNTNYYQPSKGEPFALSFFDDNSLASNRIWGQGAEFHMAPYVVSKTVAGTIISEPVYNEPGGSTGNDYDSAPIRGDVVW